MMRTVRAPLHLLCLLMLLALPLLAAAQEAEAPAAEPVLLRMSYQAGETLTYRMELNGVGSVHVAGAAQAVAVGGTMDMTLKVEEVTDEGNFVIVTSMDPAGLSVSVDGQAMPMTQSLPKVRSTVTPRGETLNFELMGARQEAGMEGQLVQLLAAENFKHLMALQKVAVFPEEPVAPGAEWGGTATVEEEAGEGDEAAAADDEEQAAENDEQPAAEIRTAYVSNQEFDGVMCARLQSEAVIPAGALGTMATMLQMSGTTTTRSTTWFDTAAGRVRASRENARVNLQLSLPAAMTQGQGDFRIFMEMLMDTDTWLLPPGEG